MLPARIKKDIVTAKKRADHRKYPFYEGALVCRFCGEAIIPRLKKNGEAARNQKTFHDDCSENYSFIRNLDSARSFIAQRDGKQCIDCGATQGLEVDHDIPLWKVAEAPEEIRRWYYTVANMRLLCTDCHKAKTKREAAQRAHIKRLLRGKRPTKNPMRSRGFEKGVRKKMNGQVERRT